MAWSNTHCEVISTASSDCSWRAWSFNASDAPTLQDPWNEFMVGCPNSEFKTYAEKQEIARHAISAKMIGDYDKSEGPLISSISSF